MLKPVAWIGLTYLLSSSCVFGITRAELLKLVGKGIEAGIIVSLVEKDCVDFEVDALAVLELSERVPSSVIEAAIECRKRIGKLEESTTPPGASPVADDISLVEAPALALRDVRTIVVIPLLLDDTPDAALTAAFVHQLRERKSKYKLVDSLQLQVHFEDTGAFSSAAPLKSLLAAAREEGADGIIVGSANTYRAFDDYAIRLDAKLVEVNRGEVVWSDGARGKSGLYSWQACKKHTARNVVKKMP